MENTDTKGYVYILVNPAFPGFLKVGKTTKEPDARARELSSGSGVPAPYAVAWDAFVNDRHAVEKLIHHQLDHVRSRKEREFFAIPLKNAISVVSNIIAPFVCGTGMQVEAIPSATIEAAVFPNPKQNIRKPNEQQRVQEKLILVADDCPVQHSVVPEKNIPRVEYETFIDNPYRFTEEEFFHEVNVVRRNRPHLKYKTYKFTRSLLPRQFGWGIHINEYGKAALVAIESALYQELQKSIKTTKSFRKGKT